MEQQSTIFESIRHTTDYGGEYWVARELMLLLGYDTWQRFENVIEKAKESCENSGNSQLEEFLAAPLKTPLDGGRPGKDYVLSRYACYLIAQNGDPRKLEIALAQSYFAIQARKQELGEKLLEDKRRVMLREEMRNHNLQLAAAAKEAGVIAPIDYAIFQNWGYKGLYAGLGMKEIQAKKGLKKSQQILDHMTSEELAANLFRATQAEAKLKREGTKGKEQANNAHFEVGKKVRKTIENLGGTMPEKLPSVESIEQSKKRLKIDCK